MAPQSDCQKLVMNATTHDDALRDPADVQLA
jgi:hypothetical protein